MIDRTALLNDLKRLVTRVEADLLARSEDSQVPEIVEVLRGEYERARAAKRTADTYGEWREDRITQAAVAWVLSCVFVRFLEDNDLISPPRIAGPGERLRQARDAHQHYFLSHPRDTDREYLLSIFDELAASPGTSGIFGAHNALREIPNWLSGDTAREVIQFFQKIDANTGLLIHDFTDPAWDTRFLGDLYQDLSAYARSRYALLQTPHFIEQFLLDRTLEPAIDEFGLSDAFKMIDPACGSGHLVLGSFERILDRWQRSEPATPVRELVRRTLGSVHGVDINPFAVAIARFRLLLVAMRACAIKRLADAPDFRLNVECGDSLLHVPLIGGQTQLFDKHEGDDETAKQGRAKKAKPADDECEHVYASENLNALKLLLRQGQYHAVVANPPYITPKDSGVRDRYRLRFMSCHMKYSLSVPFMEHIFRLGISGGFSGQITAASFMTREFGKHLVEGFLPSVEVTHVIDTSGAVIPGHKTSTVIIFGRHREPRIPSIRAAQGIRGDSCDEASAANGVVWTSILQLIDSPGAENEFVSVTDTPRDKFQRHPWSLGGGGVSELRDLLERNSQKLLSAACTDVGIVGMTNADEVMKMPPHVFRRMRLTPPLARKLVAGDTVRDWSVVNADWCVFPYMSGRLVSLDAAPELHRFLWSCRTTLGNRATFSQRTYFDEGRPWWEWHQTSLYRLSTPLSIVFAEIETRNHFSLDAGGNAFNQTGPVIKLPPDAGLEAHLGLLGVLNSSSACFWLKQVVTGKTKGDGGASHADPVYQRFQYNSTKVKCLPLPAEMPMSGVSAMQQCLASGESVAPKAVVDFTAQDGSELTTGHAQRCLRSALACARQEWLRLQQMKIAVQEDLDWQCYRLYGLFDAELTYEKPLPPVRLGERAFEIVMARRMAAGDLATTWFERHRSIPVIDIPSHWPDDYRDLIQRRIDAITSEKNIGLIERPEYKRRWNVEPWESQQAAALEAFLLDCLERLFDFDGRMNDAGKATATLHIGLASIGSLADAATQDPLFMEAAEVFVGAAGFDVTALVGQLVEKASIPFLPVLRYKAAGLRKHEEWKEVWELQRKEDAITARTSLPSDDRNQLSIEQAADLKRREVGDIPVPPTYTSADFLSSTYWDNRSPLDVPRERFISFPFVTGADGQMMIAWAGLDHLQFAKAIGDFYGLVQTEIGGSDDPRLVPLLAALHELVPWIRQWHAGNDPVYGGEPADFFEDFLRTEAAGRGMTVAEVLNWQPPARTRPKSVAKKAAKKTAKRATKKQVDEAETP